MILRILHQQFYSYFDLFLIFLDQFAEIEYILPGFLVARLNRERVISAYKKNIKAKLLISFLQKNIDPSKAKSVQENREFLQGKYVETDKHKILEYLQLFSEKNSPTSQQVYSLPENVIQQLQLWELEKEIQYSTISEKIIEGYISSSDSEY